MVVENSRRGEAGFSDYNAPMTAFTHLFQPLRIRGCTLKNRIMSSGHDTTLPVDGTVNAALVAYKEARARGGVGLIVLQVSGVHETARYTNHVLMATDDTSIAGYRSVAQAVHRHGTVLFGQLFHPGREMAEADGGLLSVAYAPSAGPPPACPHPLRAHHGRHTREPRRRNPHRAAHGI